MSKSKTATESIKPIAIDFRSSGDGDLVIAKRHTIANALRVAAEQYDADALAHKQPPPEALMPQPQRDRIVWQFEQQAANARALAEAIEQAAEIRLED